MKTINKALAYLPTKLPTGMTNFDRFLDSIVELAGPIADTRSMKWVISNEIMRLDSGKDRVSKMYFIKRLRKYAANQLSAAKVNQLKTEQDEEIAKLKAEATANNQAEATATLSVANGEAKN